MQDISLELYRIFFIVAESKNISKAAERLFVSQSAVSQAIMQLEQKLGGRLFDRGARGVTLTPEGEVLYAYVENAISMIENAQEKLQKMRKLSEGEIKIGASDTICSLFLLPRLKKFNEEYPGVYISVTNRVTSESIGLLKSGAVDISFVNLPIDGDPQLEIIPVMPVHDCFVAGKKYAFLADGVHDYSVLYSYPVLMLEQASNTRLLLDRLLSENNVQINPAIELGSLSLLAEFAVIGLGVAATIREDVKNMLDSGELYELRFKKELPARHIGLVKMKNMALSPAAKKFMDNIYIS